MKKLFGILLIGLALLPGLVSAGVEDITSLDTFGTDSRTATINNLEEQVISIDINWGELKYDYIYSEDSYVWEAANGSNTIMVNVNSGNVTATLDWTSAIEGVEVKEYLATIQKAPVGCVSVDLSGDVDPNQVVYREGTCQTIYQEGETYIYGQTYMYDYRRDTEEGHNQSVNLIDSGYQTVTWTIDLVGGSLEGVKTAYATEEKIIGEFTITIADNSSVSE